MSEQPRQLPAIDTDPSGDEILLESRPLSAEEIALGEQLGEIIDLEDDYDNGGLEGLASLIASGARGAGQPSALVHAKALGKELAYCGVKYSIELQPGRSVGSLDRWDSNLFEMPMNHDTVGPMSGNTPSLYVCKHGRSDLPGPLCNGYGGRDLVYRIITMGPANHPGLGGPMMIGGVSLPKNNARPYTWGTEFEHDGVSKWPASMREFMARFSVAYARWKNIPISTTMDHDTWAPTRKIDRSPGTRGEFLAEAEQMKVVIDKEHNVSHGRTPYTIKRGLQEGDHGKDVEMLQARLNMYFRAGELPGVKRPLSEDGQFGRLTGDAVYAFKKAEKFKGMDANRKVGGGTVKALGGFLRWGG